MKIFTTILQIIYCKFSVNLIDNFSDKFLLNYFAVNLTESSSAWVVFRLWLVYLHIELIRCEKFCLSEIVFIQLKTFCPDQYVLSR